MTECYWKTWYITYIHKCVCRRILAITIFTYFLSVTSLVTILSLSSTGYLGAPYPWVLASTPLMSALWLKLHPPHQCPCSWELASGHAACYPSTFTPHSLPSFYLFIFREGKGGNIPIGKKTSVCGCLLSAPYWGPAPQPRHLPWLGINWWPLKGFAGQCSIHWATPARTPSPLFTLPLWVTACFMFYKVSKNKQGVWNIWSTQEFHFVEFIVAPLKSSISYYLQMALLYGSYDGLYYSRIYC